MKNPLITWYRKLTNLDKLDKAKKEISGLEKELTEINKSQRMFLHETRGTVGNMEQFADLLETILENPDNKGYANDIKNSAYKTKMVLEAVGAATLSQDKLKQSYHKFNPLETLKRNRENNKTNTKKINLDIELNGKDTQIYTSEPLVYTLVNTWTQNAMTYAPEGSTIKQEIIESEKDITIKLENIHNGKSAREEIGLSEGLGTSFTKRIINKLGGKFETYSKPEINSESVGYFKNSQKDAQEGYQIFGVKLTIPKS